MCERTDRTWLLRYRASHFLGSILSDVGYALRLFRTSPLFAVMASLCLAVGITFITTTYTILDDTVLHPLHFEEPEELVMVGPETTLFLEMDFVWSSYADFRDWEAQSHVFEHLAAMTWEAFAVTDLDDPVRVFGTSVTEDFLNVLKVTPLLGRAFAPDDYLPGAERVALIGHALWQRACGGDPAVIGRRITLNGEQGYQVVGVLPLHFSFPAYQEVWVPLRREEPGPHGWTNFLTVGRLRDGTSIETAESELRQIEARLVEAYPEEYPENFQLNEFRVVPFGSYLFRPLHSPFLIIFTVGCLVLLLTCSNLANLVLSRATDRTRELSVRAVLGAGRSRLIQQVMIENLVIALAGGVIGIVLGRLALYPLLSNMPRELPGFIQFEMNLRVLAVLVGIVVLSGLIFGLAPAFAVRRCALGTSLRHDAARMSPGRKQALTCSSLVVLQIGLATIILVVTGLMMKDYLTSRARQIGVDTDHLLGQYMSLPEWSYQTPQSRFAFFQSGVERLRNRPGVEAAAYISQAPAARTEWSAALCTNETAANSERPFLNTRIRMVSPGYFETARIPLLAGRDFTAADMSERPRICLVNRVLARTLWGDADPVGRSFFWSREPVPERAIQVVGMVGDVRHGGPGEEAGPCFYLPLNSVTSRIDGWLIVRSAGDPKALAPVLRETIRELDPNLAMSAPRTITELAWERNWRTIFVTWIITVISIFALILALVGIFAVVACEVANRRREFGIRMALGASARTVTFGVLRKGAVMGGIGITIGVLVTAASARLLIGAVAGIEARDPMIYIALSTFLFTTTLLASYLPTRRIGRIDPVDVLREE